MTGLLRLLGLLLFSLNIPLVIPSSSILDGLAFGCTKSKSDRANEACKTSNISDVLRKAHMVT